MLPLEGLIVIAVEQAVAAPFCSSRLADAGAHVIKVERPEGDFARGYDAAAKGQSSYFVWLNRGKDSVVIDLATRQGRQTLEDLIAGADVLIQNLKPGSMDKLGFSLERLRKDYPALICCTISGYGDDGPYADRKAYDLLIQAESGLASITGGPDGPSRVGLSIVDIATGATAHAAILEALIARSRVRNRKLTDQTVGDIFATMTRGELLQRLSDADIAFAEVNTMVDLAVHPHLRRIEVDTPAGPVSYPAPAAIVVDQPRHYGAVPRIGERIGVAKPSHAR